MQNIETTSDDYTILLVSEPSMTITALISCLEQVIKSSVSLVEKQQINEKLATASGLVLIDLSAFEGDNVSFVKQSLAPFSDQHVFALFNAHDLSAKELASWPFIKGVFKKRTILNTFATVLRKCCPVNTGCHARNWLS